MGPRSAGGGRQSRNAAWRRCTGAAAGDLVGLAVEVGVGAGLGGGRRNDEAVAPMTCAPSWRGRRGRSGRGHGVIWSADGRRSPLVTAGCGCPPPGIWRRSIGCSFGGWRRPEPKALVWAALQRPGAARPGCRWFRRSTCSARPNPRSATHTIPFALTATCGRTGPPSWVAVTPSALARWADQFEAARSSGRPDRDRAGGVVRPRLSYSLPGWLGGRIRYRGGSKPERGVGSAPAAAGRGDSGVGDGAVGVGRRVAVHRASSHDGLARSIGSMAERIIRRVRRPPGPDTESERAERSRSGSARRRGVGAGPGPTWPAATCAGQPSE